MEPPLFQQKLKKPPSVEAISGLLHVVLSTLGIPHLLSLVNLFGVLVEDMVPVKLFIVAPVSPLCFFFTSASFQPYFPSTVSANVGACPLLLLRGGCVHSTKPEFWDHQEVGVSKPTGLGSLYVPLCKGQSAYDCMLPLIMTYFSQQEQEIR